MSFAPRILLLSVVALAPFRPCDTDRGPSRQAAYPEAALPSMLSLPRLEKPAELLAPEIQGMFLGALFATNQAGFRGRFYARNKPEGVLRIAVAGGPAALGVGVWQGEEYPALLELLINATDPSMAAEVLNLAVPVSDPDVALERIVELGRFFRPDVIVFAWTAEEVSYPGMDEAATAVPQAGIDELPLRRRLALAGRELAACAVWFVQPGLSSAWLGKAPPEPAGSEDTARLHVVQSAPIFAGIDVAAVHVPQARGLPNAVGHRLIARALYEGLKELPPSCLLAEGPANLPGANGGEPVTPGKS